eukprot:3537294-Prymnesium_polylepis.1
MYLEASETTRAENDDEADGDEDGTVYAMKYGDSVTAEKTNTYDLKGFQNATNHGRLVKEVEKARADLTKMESEKQLIEKWGMVHKDQ